MDLLLGIDIGTTAVKAGVFDTTGHLIASTTTRYQRGLASPQQGWVEHDAEDIWLALVESIRAVTSASRNQGHIVALSLSTQGGTTIAVDATGQPLRPAVSWMDTRAQFDTGPLVAGELGPTFVYNTTGWWSDSGLPLQHIVWLRHHEPDTFSHAARFLFVNDFVLLRMTGEPCMDPSNAAITMLYNLKRGEWDDRLLHAAGITRTQLSSIAPSGAIMGRLRTEIAELLGLSDNIKVVNGAHDQYCGAVGAGVIEPGQALVSGGTAWVLIFMTQMPIFDERQVFHPAPHAAPGRWGLLSSIPSAGAAVEWFLKQVAPPPGSKDVASALRYDWFNNAAARASAGSHGLLFIPHLGGFFSAAGDTPVKGAWVGLTLAHTCDDMARSVMEAAAYEVRRLVELAASLNVSLDTLVLIGGATRSPVWPQIIADVLGLPVCIAPVSDAACRGAAILAGVGAGVFRDIWEGVVQFRSQETRFEPDQQHIEQYRDLYSAYLDTFSRLRPVFIQLSRHSSPC